MTDHEKRIREALEETLLFCETFSNRWDGQTGAHPFGMVERARAALSEAKAGGWLPIEQASDEDKLRCWVLVGEAVHLAAYIVISFEEKRDLDGCYIGQVDRDEYWMDIDSGDTLEPTHFQPLARPLPAPPAQKEPT